MLCFRGIKGGFGEAASGQVHFAEISTPILEKVIQFVYYKVRCWLILQESADGWVQVVPASKVARIV